MPAVQVQAALARRCGRRHVGGRDDCVGARCRRFLGGVVRALSDDRLRARGSGHASRGGSQDREGRRRRESRTRYEVWRAVDPVAGRDPGRARDRPSCRRASSRCAGAAVAVSARRLSVDPGSTFRERGVFRGAELRGPRVNEVDVIARVATHPRRLAGDQRMLGSESDRTRPHRLAGSGRPDRRLSTRPLGRRPNDQCDRARQRGRTPPLGANAQATSRGGDRRVDAAARTR